MPDPQKFRRRPAADESRKPDGGEIGIFFYFLAELFYSFTMQNRRPLVYLYGGLISGDFLTFFKPVLANVEKITVVSHVTVALLNIETAFLVHTSASVKLTLKL